jgi:SET domain-containing protein
VALAAEKIEGLLEVKGCPHGRGVFAARNFEQGDLIHSMSHMFVTTTPKSPPWKRWAMIIGRTSDGQQLFWDEEDEESDEYWSNFLDHSQRPNVRFSINIMKRTASLFAVRSIKAGEELFLDYKEYDPDNWTPG